MYCANCSDEILERATRYEEVTPVDGGGQTVEEYCSVSCLNEDVEFTDEEIKALMRQAGSAVPADHDLEWGGYIQSDIGSLASHTGKEGEYFVLLEHVERDFDVEIFHDPQEQLYEVVLYTYDVSEGGDKVGLEEVKKQYTGMFQRALAYAERMMESVEEYDV
jgi:hypothetical protein